MQINIRLDYKLKKRNLNVRLSTKMIETVREMQKSKENNKLKQKT